jgi:signal transduction protein with GAF and PtsI domain
VTENLQVQGLHEIGRRFAAADPMRQVLARVVEFVSGIVQCDSCFIYVLDGDQLVLGASKNPHPEALDKLKLAVGEGITGWVAVNRRPVAIGSAAWKDPRFRFFLELPEDTYEAFLSVPILCRGRVVGVINLQHRLPHSHTQEEIRLVETLGFLVGAEIEMARLEREISQLSGQLEARKIVERAKGILQKDLRIVEDEAYRILRQESRQRRKPMKEVAQAVVLAEDLRRSLELRQKSRQGV